MQRITADAIRAAMAKRWARPEWAIMWEVSDGTGARGGNRYADAVMMSIWPSRGLELHGVEIKVSRHDWKREAANPEKAEIIAAFCDRWWVHTAPGVVADLSEVPPAWGLREWGGQQWRTLREAEKTDAKPITRPFLAALLRRADAIHASLAREAMEEARRKSLDEIEAERRRLDEVVAERVKRRTADLERRAEALAAFEAGFGVKLDGYSDYAAIGRAAQALARAADSDYGYAHLSKRLRDAADEIDAITAMSKGRVA
jgi:hypothetical protein